MATNAGLEDKLGTVPGYLGTTTYGHTPRDTGYEGCENVNFRIVTTRVALQNCELMKMPKFQQVNLHRYLFRPN